MIAITRWKIFAVVAAVIFGVLFTLPNLLPDRVLNSMPGFLPHQRLNLGLDLQGGSQLLLEVDLNYLRQQRMNQLVEETRQTLTDQSIAASPPVLQGGVVTTRIANAGDVNRAVVELRRAIGQAGGAGRTGATVNARADQRIEVSLGQDAMNAESANAVTQSLEIVRRRIDSLGTREATIVPQGQNRIVVQAPGESDPERLKAVIGRTAQLTFQMVDDQATPEELVSGNVRPGSVRLPQEGVPGEPFVVVRSRVLVSGEMLTRAQQSYDQQTSEPVVAFTFNGEGARRFGAVTARNVGKRFAIVLDGQVISAPTIQTPITGGSGQITGNFTAESANELAVLLNSGALPTRLNVESQTTVGPELGADSVRAGSTSLAIGAVLIVIFIVLAYGLFGGFAAAALVVNVLMMVGILTLGQFTLTLPGIAGLILTLAVAVDANVLIYERIRDEARAQGRSPFSAVDTGYRRALVSIIDANVTTLISALIMLWLGAGPVRGFALTLIIGVITSVFTAVIITQLLIGYWFRWTKPKKLPFA